MKKFYVFLSFLFFSVSIFSQESSRSKVLSTYDTKKLNELKQQYEISYLNEIQKAIRLADSLGVSKNIPNSNGFEDQLVGLIGENQLKYYSIDNNTTAAATTRTNYLNTTYNLFGSGLTVGVWDGGPMRTTHVEFGSRASIGDGTFALNSNSFHATHVAGTIGATGVNPAAKGMAPLATIKGFDWFNDISEVISQAQSGMLVSNHSYGVPLQNSPSWYMGAYSNDARDWDEVAFNLPYYLMVASAGNNGSDNNPSPLAAGFDKLTGNKVSKNNLVIANTQQAIIDASGNLVSVSINSGSSQGPSDDRRIKPDIAGQGSGLLSAGDATNSSYLTLSGTSMSAPNISGSLILLQEYFERENDRYMKAATLKGLVCHTADDAGNVGPDAVFGWGLMNSKKAAELILYNGLSASIIEGNINQGQTITYTFKANANEPFKATVCWTDPAGNAINGVLNSTIPALVNDLDVRITNDSQTFFPWKLQSNPSLEAVRNGDNNVDNVESVLIDSPIQEEYTITITHKGTLENNLQNFSLIVSGIDATFSLLPLNSVEEVCSNENAVYNLDFKNVDFSNVSLQATNLPSGATVSFSEQTVVVETIVVMTISNLTNVPAGEYYINVVATKGQEEKIINLTLKVFNDDFENMDLLYPLSNSNNVSPNSEFSWNENSNATSYRLQVSQNADFQTLLIDQVVESTTYLVESLSPNQSYYWRVLPINLCGQGESNNTGFFKTANLICDNSYTATNFSNSSLSATSFSEAIIPITISDSFIIGDVSVNFNVSHTSVQELKVFLEGPASIGSPLILLIDQSCGDFPDINATVNDGGSDITCSTASPAISGTFSPVDQLSYLNNKPVTGEWKLIVRDGIIDNGGQVNSFSLNFCRAEQSLELNDFSQNSVFIYPNPSNGIFNVEYNFESSERLIQVYDIQGRVILQTNPVESKSILDLSSHSKGLYFVKCIDGAKTSTKKVIVN